MQRMSDHHARQLLTAAMYRISMQDRRQIMAEAPAAYAAYCREYGGYHDRLAETLAEIVRETVAG